MTDMDADDGIIRMSPENGEIILGLFTATTTFGPVRTPVLVFEDARFGPVHILLNPADDAALRLCQQMVAYVQSLVQEATTDQAGQADD